MQDVGPGADDPFTALAQIKARRAMADLAGFPHDPAWDEQERDALARLRTGSTEAGAAGRADEPDAPTSNDPLADLARVAALRIAADSMGLHHDPDWDREEADVTRQLRDRG